MVLSRVPLMGLVLGVLLTPRVGSAANGSKPRVPVVWSEGPCATVVDRSATTTVHFDYIVPYEDLGELTSDEVDDSRTHQFFAFTRLDYAAFGTAQQLPPWIGRADIDRAAVVDPEVVPENVEPIDVLGTTTRFAADEWLRITADDARVPISDAQALLGVDWDVTEVPSGVYTIWGYTWEPLTNVWAGRQGFVKVVQSTAQAAEVGPAIALLIDNSEVTTGEPYPVQGCADVPAGSTVTIEWGVVDGPDEPQWAVLIEEAPISTGALALTIELPAEVVDGQPGQTLARLRATVTDPRGKQHVAYSPGSYKVIAGERPPSDEDGCRIGGDADLRLAAPLLVLASIRRRRRSLGSDR